MRHVTPATTNKNNPEIKSYFRIPRIFPKGMATRAPATIKYSLVRVRVKVWRPVWAKGKVMARDLNPMT